MGSNFLDASEGFVLLHVNHGEKHHYGAVGNVYASGPEGIHYSLILGTKNQNTKYLDLLIIKITSRSLSHGKKMIITLLKLLTEL